jgi:hypothetical protein
VDAGEIYLAGGIEFWSGADFFLSLYETLSLSPFNVPDVFSEPAGSSTTAKARKEPVIRHGGTAERTFSTRPSLLTKATSMAKRMKKVWMAFEGAMMSAQPAGSPSRFRSPWRREAESKAVISKSATT